MKNIRFLFYSGDGVFKNDHIFKEHGAIIDHLNRAGYDAEMICIDYGQTVDVHEKLNKKVRINYIANKIKLCGISLGLLSYIKRKKDIDTYILTHFSPKTLIYALWIRSRNRRAKIYLKTDLDEHWFEKRFSNQGGRITKRVVRWFLSYMDLVTVETKKGLRLLHTYAPYAQQKIHYITNGYDEDFLKTNSLEPTFEAKKNTIITIGRIGTYQKHTEKLLHILERVELQDRHAYIIGTIEPEFQKTIDIFFERYPELRAKIIFTGPIYDRKEVFKYLHEAKVYICTSRFEGFSLVFPEIISQGVSLLSTPVSGAEDIKGTILENTEDFVHTLQQYISGHAYSQQRFEETVAYAKEHFTWEKNMKKLEDLLKNMHHEDYR